MSPEPEKQPSWLDDITDLIRKKQEENQALRKVHESLQSFEKARTMPEKPKAEEEIPITDIDKDQSVMNETNQQ